MGVSNIKIQGTGRFTQSAKNFGVVDQGEFIGTSSNRGVILSSAAFAETSTNIGSVSGTAIFSGEARNTGVVQGSATFVDFAVNTGSVSSVTFAGSAINTGIVLGNAEFQGTSINSGTINGNVVFSGDSTNRGGVILGTFASDTPGDPFFINTSFLLDSQNSVDLNLYDPYFNDVQLLLLGNRTNGSPLSTVIVDSSPQARPMVRVGNAHVSTAVTKYGTGSLAVLGGGNTASLSGAGLIEIQANQPFTVEAWVYLLSGGKHCLIGEPGGGAYSTPPRAWGFGIWNTGGPNATIGEEKGLCCWKSPIDGYGGNVVYSGQYPSLSAWTHVAICRNSAGLWSFYMNGVKGPTKNGNATASSQSDFTAASGGPTTAMTFPVIIGTFGGFISPGVASGNSTSQAAGFNGYIDDFRITLGTDRYSHLSGFTPPGTFAGKPAPYQVIDSSNNNLFGSSVSVTQNPFNPYRANGWSGLHNNAVTTYAVANSTFNTPFTAIGVGKTTIEMWIYPTEFNTSNTYTNNLFGNYSTAGSNSRWHFGCVSNAALLSSYLRFSWVDPNVAGAHAAVAAPTLPIRKEQWSHVAMTVDADTPSAASINFFVNGQKSSTITANLTTQNGMAWPPSIGNNNSQYAHGLPGYFSSVRITKNQIVYTDPFPLSAIPAISQQINPSNILLLAYDSNTLMNRGLSSVTIALNNVAACSVSPSAAGPTFEYNPRTEGGSVYFSGTNSYLTLSSSAAANIGTGNFTIECWVYPMATPAASYLIHLHNGLLSNSGITLRMNSSRQLIVDNGVVAGVTFTQSVLNLSAWNHIALSKTGATTYVYTNGTLTGSANSITFNAHSMITVGAFNQAAGTKINFFTGYMANLRLVRNTGLYTTPTITIPTTLVPQISNTAVLLNFANNSVVDKTTNCRLSAIGTVHYSADQIKYGTGSLYFDGPGDYITTNTTDALTFGTKNFTVEFWVYPLEYTGPTGVGTQLFGTKTPDGILTGYSINLGFNVSTFKVITNITGAWADTVTASSGPALSAWTHMAVVRNGTNLSIYKNGTSVGSATIAVGASFSGATATIGRYSDGVNLRDFRGYLTGLRATKGIARYTTTFTPPSASLPGHV
jgi:hypothetical protein